MAFERFGGVAYVVINAAYLLNIFALRHVQPTVVRIHLPAAVARDGVVVVGQSAGWSGLHSRFERMDGPVRGGDFHGRCAGQFTERRN